MDIIGGLMGLGAAGIDAAAASQINKANISMQRETNALNEKLMRESWQREDSAVQRRAADLKAAGQSPLLAAGAAAQSSGPVSMTAPRQSEKSVSASMIMQGIAQGLQMKKTEMDIAAQKQQMRIADMGAYIALQDSINRNFMVNVEGRTKPVHAEAAKTSAQASMWQAQTAAQRQALEDRKWRETGAAMAQRSMDLMRAQHDAIMHDLELSRQWNVRKGDSRYQELEAGLGIANTALKALPWVQGAGYLKPSVSKMGRSYRVDAKGGRHHESWSETTR